MRKIIIILMLMTVLISMTGCWDSTAINEREYIFAVGIDKEGDSLNFTAEYPKINEGEEQQRLVFTEKCDNFAELFDVSFFRTEKVISDRLMQVIVLGEDIAKDSKSVKKLFDEIQRSPQMNRRVKIAVSKGNAKDIINTEIPSNPIVGRYLSESLIKLKKQSFQDVFTFDEAVLRLGKFGSVMIPLLETNEDSIRIIGAAVMKDYKLVGFLNNNEVEQVMIMLDGTTNNLSNKIVNVDDYTVSLSVVNMSKTKDVQLQGENLAVNYYITLYCLLDSFTVGEKHLEDVNFLDKIEKAAIEKVTNDAKETIKKIQKDYNVDLLRIKDDLYKYHKVEYEKVSDKYDEIFENAVINVYFNTKIMNTGLVK